MKTKKRVKVSWYERISSRQYLFLSLLILALFVITLLLLGRVPICECGYVKLWHGVVFSSENSQHLADWYSFSHIIHGFVFYFGFWFLGKKLSKKGKIPLALILLLILITEAGWEVFENTPFIIERYRAVTISLDYYGDSVVNSFMDVMFTMLGAAIAFTFPVWGTILVTLSLELFVLYFIRDNLTLNVIMLIYPIKAILVWQQAAYSLFLMRIKSLKNL